MSCLIFSLYSQGNRYFSRLKIISSPPFCIIGEDIDLIFRLVALSVCKSTLMVVEFF